MTTSTLTPLMAFARRQPGTFLPGPARTPPWSPVAGLEECHVELFGGPQDCAGPAFALALESHRATSGDERPWLWVQDRAALRLTGRPYRPGLPSALRHRLIHVATTTPEDALFALEEGLRCRDLAFVVGEIAGNPRAFSLTAQRRLSLVAEKHGVPLWLVRVGATRDLSSARQRWTLRPAPSLPPRWNGQAPGTAAWHAELFRARNHPPGEWILRDDGHALIAQPVYQSTHPVGLAGAAGDRPLAAG